MKSEQGVDEGRKRRTLRKDNKSAKKCKENNRWKHPILLPCMEKGEEL